MISVEGISKTFGAQKALDNVSFKIDDGQIVGLLGPNGAGKSTLMKIITGYVDADCGRVYICGKDARQHPLDVRRNIGYLPEHNPLYLDMFVREYLTMVARMYDISNKQKVDDIIGQTGLTKECHKQIGALSKGYRQRVGIAQALISNPRVVILDEPTTGLDPNQIEEIRVLIRTIGQDRTVLLSTHLMQEVDAVCDRVIIINNGKILADGNVGNIAKQCSQNMIVEVEFDSSINEEILTVATHSHIEKIGDNLYRLLADNQDDIRVKTFNFAVKNNLAILEMRRVDTDISQIFHQLTQK